ncbi:MAG: hypothetical protein KIT84_42670 [Labilithrix sp.]|nr:hypothetical protein [Labilithrix sp.]MCW5817782.1 hypothetical protein [Labilithrix sp.]
MNLRLLTTVLFFSVTSAAALGATGCTVNNEGPSGGSSSGDNDGPTSLDGTYSGIYSGDGTGPVTMTISGTNIDVVVTVSGKQYPATGSVTADGGVSVGVGTGEGVVVTFQGTFANGKGSGTWQSSISTKGSWSVSK